MEGPELARWTRFAAKGGIGKCKAVQDCVAETPEDLMFLKDDNIIVLMQVPDHDGLYLGYCEGVVGHFRGAHVQFYSRLKRPVMTKRSSVVSAKSPPPETPSPVPGTRTSRVSTSRSPPRSTLIRITPDLSSGQPDLSHPSEPPGLEKPPVVGVIDLTVPHSPAFSSASSPVDDSWMTPSRSYASISTASDSVLATPSPRSSSHPEKGHHHLTDMKQTHDVIPLETASHDLRSQSPPNHVNTRPPNVSQPPAPSLPGDLSSQSLHERTYDSERSKIVSAAISDGELGIGLSLLQDLVNSADDWSSTEGDDSEISHLPTEHRESSDSVQPGQPTTIEQPSSTSDLPPPHSRSSSHSISSPTFNQRSQSGLRDDWEGASDIYDDYRYSGQSMASKISRFSQTSAHNTNTTSKAPPLPTDSYHSTERKQSADSEFEFSAQSSKLSTVSKGSTTPLSATPSNHVPAALDLSFSTLHPPKRPAAEASPLIQTNFVSPSTPEANSAYSGSSYISSALTPVSFTPPAAGAASALRQKLENGRVSPANFSNVPTEQPVDDGREGRNIVIDDDEVDHHHLPVDPDANSEVEASSSSSHPPDVDISQFPSTFFIANRTPSPPPTDPSTTAQSDPNLANISPPDLTSPLSSAPVQVPSQDPPPAISFSQTGSGLSRRSLFLPHPNAPKPTPSPAGPMYARRASIQPMQNPPHISNGSVIHIIHMAVAGQRGRSGPKHPPTIYGKCVQDLANSTGPIPITFSLEPSVTAHPQGVNGSNVPGMLQNPVTSTTTTSSAVSAPKADATSAISSAPPPSSRPATTSSINPQSRFTQGTESTSRSSPVAPTNTTSSKTAERTGNVLPRANFFPKVQTSRPRSRSFSGFNLTARGAKAPSEHSREAASKPHNGPALKSPPESSSSSSSSSSPSLLQKLTGSKAPTIRAAHAPSPLSLPENNSVVDDQRLPKSPTSAFLLTQSVPVPTRLSPLSPTFPIDRPAPQLAVRQVRSSATLNGANSSLSSRSRPPLSKKPSTESETIPPAALSPLPRRSLVGDVPIRRSSDVDISQSNSERSHVVSPPLVRTSSLRSKLSLPNLRGKNVGRSRQDSETVQIKDMDFELVHPVIPQMTSTRPSEDSFAMSRSASLDVKPDFSSGRLRADSPSFSISSGGASSQRSPTVSEAPWHKSTKVSESDSSMDAHRQRELKWMSVISSVPAPQARKNKKVKKLLLDGVPLSVRFLVWAHLTDSKARGVPGVYAQLGQRGKAYTFAGVGMDIQRCFANQPQLQTIQGSLLSLLQAYLTMVPDIRYQTALTYVVGHLLLLSPEEDAFWIFVSIMDTHLRPYFASNVVQVEVDALLFSKALEIQDPPLAKKIFFDLGVTPTSICRPWFCCVFAETLPTEYMRRVWDLFLFEGIPFLFRVGLALISCCRRQLFQSNSGESLLLHLLHPPPLCLPPTPDAFLAFVYSVKLKDDDIRKQRVKMEAQVKRQTQSRLISTPSASSSSTEAPPISLQRS